MALGNNYAEKFSPLVDEAFYIASLTQGLTNNDYDWVGVNAVNVYSIPTVALDDYTMSGSSRYGTPSELQNDVQTLTLSQDKSFTFTIDRKQEQDTMGAMNASAALARELREVVIPHVDKYRIATLISNAPADNTEVGSITASNAYSEFLKVQEDLDDALAPQGGRVALVTPAFYNYIKLDPSFVHDGDRATEISMNGQVGWIDGVPVIKAPTSYFTAGTNFVITNAIAMPSPIKLQDYKIHIDPPGINGFLVEGRIRFDAFVLTNKADAIGVHKVASSST